MEQEWQRHTPFTIQKDVVPAEIIPFVIWPLEEDEAAICPKRALCEWLQASGIREGYLFPKLTSDGRAIKRVTGKAGEHMSQAVFLEMFRNNLLDVNIDFTPYGTHSFRRGGCQYLILFRRWNIRRVCEWGGWSTDFTYLTIVKYLISWVDEPMSSRADFFRPGQKVASLRNDLGTIVECGSRTSGGCPIIKSLPPNTLPAPTSGCWPPRRAITFGLQHPSYFSSPSA